MNSTRIAFYIRSTNGNLADLKRQLKALDREVIRRGFDHGTCSIEVFKDAQQSGLTRGREFDRMCGKIENQAIDVVMVSKMNRIPRKFKKLLSFQTFLKRHHVRFFSVRENVDSNLWYLQISAPEPIQAAFDHDGCADLRKAYGN